MFSTRGLLEFFPLCTLGTEMERARDREHCNSSQEHILSFICDFLQQNLLRSKYEKNVLVSNTDSVTSKTSRENF